MDDDLHSMNCQELSALVLHEILNPHPEKVRMYRAIDRAHKSDGWDRFRAWRECYDAAEPFIMQNVRHRWICDVYSFWRDGRIFTPIEREFFSVMRIVGIVLYPQYPVGKYFVDFGHPVAKVAVECDGADWHDPVKDMARDAELATMGWKVFRLQGKDIFQEWYPGYRNGRWYRMDDEYEDPRDRRDPWETGEYDPASSLAMYLGVTYGIGYGCYSSNYYDGNR